MLEWQSPGDDCHMMVDEDYMEFMTDTLFSTITANQPFAFPDTREIAYFDETISPPSSSPISHKMSAPFSPNFVSVFFAIMEIE
ncbi:hypothetical protein J6590_093523 [Homalodisca vitripennis]|nr:hypothetical protein J6590_093523 [Homalodisca vitripennis]